MKKKSKKKDKKDKDSKHKKKDKYHDKKKRNSTDFRSDWQAFGRYVSNKRRCPAKIIAACKDKDARDKIFQDYLDCNRDTSQVEAKFEARLEESQRTQLRYGFRNDIWLNKHHGERKANKIMARKKQLGLTFSCTLGTYQPFQSGPAWPHPQSKTHSANAKCSWSCATYE